MGENNGRAVVGASKINPSLGEALEKKFLKTTQYNPSACAKSCPKLSTATKEKNSDQKIGKYETEGNSKRGSIVGLDKEAQLWKGQELSKVLGFIENKEENVFLKVYNSTPVDSCKVGVPSGITSGILIHPGIYSSRHPASKKKPDQPRAVKKKVAKKHSSQKLPWFSKGRSFLGKGKETSHFARERNKELKQWSKFLNSGFTSEQRRIRRRWKSRAMISKR